MSDINEEQKRLYKRAEENDIKLLQEENKKLKELCDKYEEEHKTTFKEWKKDINIIDELEKYIKENVESCRITFNETQDIKWLDYIEIYGCIEYKLKGDNK